MTAEAVAWIFLSLLIIGFLGFIVWKIINKFIEMK